MNKFKVLRAISLLLVLFIVSSIITNPPQKIGEWVFVGIVAFIFIMESLPWVYGRLA